MVTSRKVRAADAAIGVIAAEGLRGLTHRAVDARAGLPAGSTSSCFRTRLALLEAVLDRILELDEATLERHWPTEPDPDVIVASLVGLLEYWAGPAQEITRARIELYLEAARNPGLRPHMEAASLRFLDRANTAFEAAGVPDPKSAARVIISQLDGFLYDAVARPFYGAADRAWLERAVRVAVRSLHL